MITLKKVDRIIQSVNMRYHQEGEKDFGPSLVEPGESLPIEMQIERMMRAGEIISANNQLYYEFQGNEEVPEDYIDPTRRKGFDVVDAGYLARELRERVERQIKEKEKENVESSTGSSSEGSESTNDKDAGKSGKGKSKAKADDSNNGDPE